MTIAVDFDGTIYLNGNPNVSLIGKLKQEQLRGGRIILFTSRTGANLKEAIVFCAKYGLRFNSVYGGKPIADIYIDDKAVKP